MGWAVPPTGTTQLSVTEGTLRVLSLEIGKSKPVLVSLCPIQLLVLLLSWMVTTREKLYSGCSRSERASFPALCHPSTLLGDHRNLPYFDLRVPRSVG
jgi:hypothetical protein